MNPIVDAILHIFIDHGRQTEKNGENMYNRKT